METIRDKHTIAHGMAEDLTPKYVEPQSLDAAVFDPPYGISFIGQNWDKALPSREVIEHVYTGLKPGAFCVVFAFARTYHRMAVLLEDVGFEIKDQLIWMYAVGNPRSRDQGKEFDRKAGLEVEEGYSSSKTEEGKMWDGFGTSLKTAHEPIVLAQKPCEGSILDNLLKWHVGAINIDECRIPYLNKDDKKQLSSFMNFKGKNRGDDKYFSANSGNKKQVNVHPNGRHPSNVLWTDEFKNLPEDIYYPDGIIDYLNKGYRRYFLVPKPSKSEKRLYNLHSTVKPLSLMVHLVKMATPRPSRVPHPIRVLDPYMGSGTTGKACHLTGRHFVGFEMEKDYYDVAKKRLSEAGSFRHKVSLDLGDM